MLKNILDTRESSWRQLTPENTLLCKKAMGLDFIEKGYPLCKYIESLIEPQVWDNQQREDSLHISKLDSYNIH